MYTLEQQKANRKIWVEALRSGKYKQGDELLHHKSRYCCLGVLAHVSGVSDRDLGDQRTLRSLSSVMDFVGLRDNCGEFYGDNGGGEPSLAHINDDGAPFSEIADIIESEPPGLFRETA